MPVGFATAMDRSPCPCGGGLYIHCCAPLHRYDRRAATAEQLMRSRYSAFVRGEVDYLIATHPESQLPLASQRRQLQQSCRAIHWQRLCITAIQAGGLLDVEGTVSFEAFHRGGVLRETSLFQRRNGSITGDWLYVRAVCIEA